MAIVRSIFHAFTASERRGALLAGIVFAGSAVGFLAVTVAVHSAFVPVAGGVYREGIVGQPSIIHPLVSGNPADQDLSALVFAPVRTLLTNLERSKDASVYTLKLKENLTWDDGMPLTSDDIVFTVATAQDPAAESAFAAALRGVSVERVSMLQTTLTLPSPSVLFEDLLARLPVIPAHIWGKIPVRNSYLSEYALSPVGNGPYRVEGFSKARDGFISEYHLVPNERFTGARPFIRDFYVRFFENSDALLNAFRLRKINGFGFVPPFPEAHEVLAGAATTEVMLPRYYAVFLNAGANDALADPNLRGALSAAVNRTRLADEVFQGDAEPFLLGGTPEHARAAYQPEKAREALVKMRTREFSLTLSVPDVPFLVKAAEMLITDWNAIGLKNMRVVKAPPARFREDVLAPRAYELVLAPHALTHPDDLYPFWHSAARGAAGENLSLYANAAIDRLLERIRITEDPAARETLIENVKAAIAKDIPAVFLVSLPYRYAHTDTLEGFSAGPFVTPSDRFLNVTEWSVARARVLE